MSAPRRYWSFLLVFSASCSCVSHLSAAPPIVPDDRDRQVLEKAMLHFLTDKESNVLRVPAAGATIVLGELSPEHTAYIRPEQVKSEIRPDYTIPASVLADLQRRNEKPGTYDSKRASFAGLSFVEGVMVEKAEYRGFLAFEMAHPKARASVEVWLPGYSQDGTQAVVRAHIGPTPHGASATLFLEKRNGEWFIKWHQMAYYA